MGSRRTGRNNGFNGGRGSVMAQNASQPWMNSSLSPEERAELVLKQMTLEEKIALLHGNGMAHASQWQMPLTHLANGGAGYVEGIKRLGIPPLFISDAAYGVRDSGSNGRYSTALPVGPGSRFELGHAGCLRVRSAYRSRIASAGLQYVAGRGRKSYPRTAGTAGPSSTPEKIRCWPEPWWAI